MQTSRSREVPDAAIIEPSKIGRARWLFAVPFALVLLLAAIFGAYRFPVAAWPLLIGLLCYAALLWRIPSSWLCVVPALLPVLNLAPWSGRNFVDELDLFLLVTVAVWMVTGRVGQFSRMAPATSWLTMLFVAITGVSLFIGILPLEPLDANALSSYYSKFNGLRLFKGLAWGVVLLFLLRAELGRNADALRKFWVPGMLAGLAVVACVALWERVAFPGLTNFSEEYRITATFGSMHVGGGAIDGYLVLALPFTLVWLSETKSLLRIALAAVLLALGSYAVLTTFSRGLYGACVAMVIALAFGAMLRQKVTGAFSLVRAVATVSVILLLCALCFAVFRAGGYRSLAAALGLLGLGFFLGRRSAQRGGAAMGLGLAIVLSAFTALLMTFSDKGAYAGYAISFLVGISGVIFGLFRPHSSRQRLSLAGFLATGLVAPLVANHWGGNAALWPTLALVIMVLALVFVNRSLKRPLWTVSPRHAAILAFVSLIFFVSVPIAGNSYFVGERFSGKSSTFGDRANHWQNALNMRDESVTTTLFGMGLGRFPAIYSWRSSRTAPPGTFTLMNEFGNKYLRLGGTHDHLGGVVLYFSQLIQPEPYQTITYTFDARSISAKAGIQVSICESLLLYAENCETKTARIPRADGSWQPMQLALTTRNLGAWHKYGKRPVKASLVNPVGETEIDIDNVHLIDSVGNDLLKNGDFGKGGDHWLFTISDFAPYHIDSVWVHALFEQGWLGLILLIVLLLYALGRLMLLIRQGQLVALALFIGLVGFIMVGTFNSLFEFPRVALLFYLMLFMALIRWDRNPSHPPKRSQMKSNLGSAG